MKNIVIHCPCLPASDYLLLLQRLCPDSVQNITVYTHFPHRIACQAIEDMVQVQKQFSQDRRVRFRNYGVFAKAPRFYKPLRRGLHKNNFSVELQVRKEQAARLKPIIKRLEKAGIGYRLCVDARSDQMEIYRHFAACGLSVCFDDPQYTDKTPELFDKWLYDPAAQGLNTFSDVINMLLLQSRSANCRHASCFGHVFRVDESLDVYLCPYRMDASTKLGSLRTGFSLDALPECEAVAKLLPEVVKKRGHCAEHCKSFSHCQGGCPLQSDDDCSGYSATVVHIRRRLLEIYHSGTLRQVNPIVKNAILNAIAFGTAFFDQQP